MKSLPNTIVLRPRFQRELDSPNDAILLAFEKTRKDPFVVKRLDDHVFIKFNAEENHFWSPQLHLEIVNNEDLKTSKIYGVFGPNPALWTFFMFLHFGVATLFIVLGVWAYSNAALDKTYTLQIGLMIGLIVIWFALYAFGRLGRAKGRPQMHELHDFMEEVISPPTPKGGE